MLDGFFAKTSLIIAFAVASITGKCHGEREAKLKSELEAKTIELNNLKKQVENSSTVVTKVEEKKDKQIVVVKRAKEVVQHEIKNNIDCNATDDTIRVLNSVRKTNTNK
jgi:hypothetical protein